MRNYKHGTHVDVNKIGELSAQTDFSASNGSPERWAIEFHFFKAASNSTELFNARLGTTKTWGFGADGEFRISGYSGQSLSTTENMPQLRSDKGTVFRLENNSGAGTRRGFVNNGADPTAEINADAYDGSMPNEMDFINPQNISEYRLSLVVVQKDFGSGWEDAHVFDVSKVRDSSGNIVDRNSGNGESGSDGRLYDTLTTNYYNFETVDPTAFEEIYDISSINGETKTPTVQIGAPITVEMSNEIGPDAITLDDGNKTYEFIFTTDGKVSTLEFPLTSDDTIPNLGDNLTLSVIKGPDTFTKTVSLHAPTGHTVRKLANPIELNQTAYSHDMGFTPMAGDHYFWLENDDFDITKNNICGPSGEPPFGYAIWHLSGAGLRKTNVVDGYGAINANPFMNAGPDQLNVAAGSTVILDASASYDTDGNIVSYEWEQTAGDDVAIDDVAASVTEFVAPSVSYNQTLSFKVTGRDEDDATGEATVNIGVLAVPIIPTISVAAVPASILLNESVPAEATVTDAVSVEWTANLVGAFAGSTEAITSFDATEAGSLTLTCTATSSTGHTASASQTLSVIDPNDIPAPGVTITPIASAMSGRVFSPEITVVDNFGEGVTYAWSANSSITIDDAELERPAFTVPIVDVDTPAQISCTVTDANGKATTATIDVLLIPYVITIDDIDTLHFELVTDGNIQAFPDMLNREKISIRVTDSEVPPGLTDENGLLILDHDIFDRIEIHSGNGGDAKKVTSVDGAPLGIRIRDSVEAHVLMGRLAPTLTLTERDPGFKMVTVAYLKGIDEGLVLTATQQEPTLKASTYKVNLAPAA